MSRRSLVFSGIFAFIALTAGVWFWNSGERLTFAPELDSSRTFSASLKIHANSPQGFGSASVEFSAILNAAVSGFDNGQRRLHLTLPYSRLRENNRVVYDSEALDDYDERGLLLQRFLTSGITAAFDQRGRPVSAVEFVDSEAFEQISQSVPPALIQQLETSLTPTAVYPALPVRGVKRGMSWTVQTAGLGSTSLRYELVELDADRAIITVAPAGPTDDGAVDYRGILELERETGWPVRGRLLIRQDSHTSGEALSIQLSLHQPGFEFEIKDEDHLGWAYLSQDLISVNLNDPDTLEYFSLHTGDETKTREEQLALLESAMLWFPPLEGLENYGLFVDREQLYPIGLMPAQLWNLRLLNQDGDQFRSDVKPYPRFNVRAVIMDNTADHLVHSPVNITALNADEVAAIHSVELDLDLYATDQKIELRIDREGNTEGKDNRSDDYQLEIKESTPRSATLRISRRDGGMIIGGTVVAVTPRSADGNLIPQYEYRISTSQVEAARTAYLEADGDHESNQTFERYLRQALYTVPDDWLNRDRIVEVRTETPFESLELSFTTATKVRHTLTVRNGAETFLGGPVVGSVTLSPYQLPTLDFPDLDIDDIVTSGVENGQLIFSLPEHGRNRCNIELLDAPQVHGSSLLIQTPRLIGWTYNDLESQLVSESGLTFFYDLPVKLQAQCITRISTRTEQVDDSERLRRIDPYTIELSDALFEDIAEVRRIQDDFFSSYPLVGRNLNGQALMILSQLEAYQGKDGGMDSRRLRFWGEVSEVTYPVIEAIETRQLEFHLPPLP